MTTIERARQFRVRLTAWVDRCEQSGLWDELEHWFFICTMRVARALIRQEAEKNEACCDTENDLIAIGLRKALDIIDAVTGREGKNG